MKKFLKFESTFFSFSINEKVKYINNLLKENDLQLVINSLIYNNSDVIENASILNFLSKKKSFINKYKLKNVDLVSLFIKSLIEQNKTKELLVYLNSLDLKKLKIIINHEVKNKTMFSNMKMCKNFVTKCNNEKQNTKASKKVIEINDKAINSKKSLTKKKVSKTKLKEKSKQILKKEIKSRKVKWSIGSLIFIFVFVICFILAGYVSSILLFYNDHILPNIYVNDKPFGNESYDDFLKYLAEIDANLESSVTLKNDNDTYSYKYLEIGFESNTSTLKKEIIDSYQELNVLEKIYTIFFGKDKKYEVTYSLQEDIYDSFLNTLKVKVNLEKKKESFQVLNGKIYYTKGINGFILDDSNLVNLLTESITSLNKEIILSGAVDKVDNVLGSINKKVASFKTLYNESQGRAKNIRNAVSKLNGTIVYAGDIFSFYKTVGPYNGSQGYIFYDKDVGSGVCQVSTTIYNVQLLLNLPIVSRYNHGEMVYYVDYGLDATVYGSSVDYKFKNNTAYPIYIEATANNGVLEISFWSNENIIKEGYTYKPRVVKVGNLAYKTYLDTYYNGEFQSTVYLNSSYYSKGKY